jgi:ribonuclease BN (tRNA processing enzyme)
MPDPGECSLPLENDGHLSLTFIGSGSAFSKRYYQTNLLIVKGQTHLLVDCGTRAPEALFRLHVPITQIQNFLITHSHADHIGGLEEVMLVNRYGPKKKPNIVISKDYQDFLWEFSLKGGASFNECHRGKFLRFEDFWNPIRPIRDRNDPRMSRVSVNGAINLRLFRTKHIPDNAKSWEDSAPSFGIIIDDRILFSSDTRFDPDMIMKFDEKFHFEQIFHDCQLFTGGVHASIDELGSLPEQIKKRMYLVHYQDTAETQTGLARELGFAGFVQQWKEYPFPTA